MPLPPLSSSFTPAVSAERRTVFVSKQLGSNGWSRRGPYVGIIVPMNGALQIAPNKGGDLVTAEMRMKLPVASGAAARCIVRDAATNQAYEVIYAQKWASHIEVYLKRSAGD